MDAIRPASKESSKQGSRPSSKISAQPGSRSGSKATEADKRTPSRSGASSRISPGKDLLDQNNTPTAEEQEEEVKNQGSGSDERSSGSLSPVDQMPAEAAVDDNDEEDLNEELDDAAAEMDLNLQNEDESGPKDSPPLEKAVSFEKDSASQVTVLKTWDGREIVMVSVECQTDKAPTELYIQPTLSRHPSLTLKDDISMGSASPTEDEGLPEDDTLLDETRESQRQSLVKPESREATSRSRADGTVSSTTNLDRRSSTEMTPFMPYNDEFGIPLLDISSDSDDSLDFETEPKEKRLLAGIGPPQILQYIRESQMEEMEAEDPTERLKMEMRENPEFFDEDGRPTGMFGGKCEFCEQNIKPFPTLEQQQKFTPETLFCCDQYREFVQFATTTAMEMEEEAKKSNRLINVKVHGHFGSKQERKAAKEKAVQSFRGIAFHPRMRERELQRRQQEAMGLSMGPSGGAHSTLGGGGGGGGGAQGGPSGASGAPPMARAPSMKAGLGMQQSGAGGLSFKDMAHAGHGGGGYQASSHGGGFEASRQMKTINYQLSSQKCLDEGWTLRAPSPIDPDNADVFTPDPLNPDISLSVLQQRPLIEKYYEDGKKFLTIFPNGTGNVFYPSGNLAIAISSTRLGHFTYVVQEDDPLFPHVRASFCADGTGFCYYSTGNVRLSYDQLGGIELDVQGGKRRRWKWWEVEPHIHAPPFQPICFSLNQQLGVRIMAHNYMTLTFLAKQRSCRFHVGTRMQVTKAKLQVPPTPNEHMQFLKKKKNHVESILAKISTLLRYPRSPKIDSILPPIRLSKDKMAVQRTTSVTGKSDRSRSKASSSVPVVTVT